MEQSGSVLHAEISDQPAALRRFLEAEAEHVAEIGRLLAKRQACVYDNPPNPQVGRVKGTGNRDSLPGTFRPLAFGLRPHCEKRTR